MEIFNKAGVIVTSTLVMVGMLIACQVKEGVEPPAPVIEAVAKKLGEHGGAAAERRLREWTEQGSVVAARELGLLYSLDANKRPEALRLLEKAARGGDTVSADYLTSRYRANSTVANSAGEGSWPLYMQMATPRHTK
ncbi:hypothetical protein [Pseudoduganella sp. OTU4001]|uniref:hypothetical protein n=1 Tax=Pseudoduganella sp. OTU4001 TaxID=3043854 RepID=UPI00313CA6E9